MSEAFYEWIDQQYITLIALAEQLYGPRSSGWKYLGIITRNDGPVIYFPHPGSNDLQIALSSGIEDYYDQALLQLAHEVIHLLDPLRDPPASILEEGIAVMFSIEAPSEYRESYRNSILKGLGESSIGKNYLHAYDTVKKLVESGVDLAAIRQAYGGFTSDQMTPEDLGNRFGVTPVLAEQLCERRVMR
jgi:hypothetical protein